MSAVVDADVVLAALRAIGTGLGERSSQQGVRISNARQRVASLIDQVENQWWEIEIKVKRRERLGGIH